MFQSLAAAVRSRAALQLEILALRQQLAVLHHSRPKRPHLKPVDRVFWACVSKLWPGWRNPLIIVKADTVVGWSRKGFRLFWTWKSRRGRTGRPAVPKDLRDLIRTMSLANPLYVKPEDMWRHFPGTPHPATSSVIVMESMAATSADG